MPFDEELQDWVVDDIPAKLVKEMESLKTEMKEILLVVDPTDSLKITRLQTRYRTYCDVITGIENMMNEKQDKGEN